MDWGDDRGRRAEQADHFEATREAGGRSEVAATDLRGHGKCAVPEGVHREAQLDCEHHTQMPVVSILYAVAVIAEHEKDVASRKPDVQQGGRTSETSQA